MMKESPAPEIARLQQRLGCVILGKLEVIDDLLVALLAGSHMLMEDVPGVGKTTLAKALARSSTRLQARAVHARPPAGRHPRLLRLQPARRHLHLQGGPIFTNVLLADEINRASPRTQSSLLEAMSEGQASIEGRRTLPAPSWSSPPRTRWSSTAPTRCPKRSWTGSGCASPSDIPPRSTNSTCSSARPTSTRSTRAAGARRRRSGGAAGDAARGKIERARPLRGGARRGHPQPLLDQDRLLAARKAERSSASRRRGPSWRAATTSFPRT